MEIVKILKQRPPYIGKEKFFCVKMASFQSAFPFTGPSDEMGLHEIVMRLLEFPVH
jgi:hypothetical protein